jgi:hypothetical protein
MYYYYRLRSFHARRLSTCVRSLKYISNTGITGTVRAFCDAISPHMSIEQPNSLTEVGVVRALIVCDHALLYAGGFVSFLCFFPRGNATRAMRSALRRCAQRIRSIG